MDWTSASAELAPLFRQSVGRVKWRNLSADRMAFYPHRRALTLPPRLRTKGTSNIPSVTQTQTESSRACETKPLSLASSKISVCSGVVSGMSTLMPAGVVRVPAIFVYR